MAKKMSKKHQITNQWFKGMSGCDGAWFMEMAVDAEGRREYFTNHPNEHTIRERFQDRAGNVNAPIHVFAVAMEPVSACHSFRVCNCEASSE